MRPSYKLAAQPHATLQGFASGSLDDDAFAPRFFVDQGLEVMVSQSYSKNLGELHGILAKALAEAPVLLSAFAALYTKKLLLNGSIPQRAIQPGWLSVACMLILKP